MFFILVFSIYLSTSSSFCSKDKFTEELYLKQLPSAHVYGFFQFVTQWNVNIFDEEIPSHFNLFPKSFAEIISAFRIAELHLSLTQGRWRYNKWGYPILDAPPGIQLWVWFHPDINKTSVDRNWHGLVHALSGQFCSSLNFIDKAVTSSPVWSMRPLGLWPEDQSLDEHLRYASLSREIVCTENLTPWKKLLPCTGEAGLGTLLNALHLYDSSYHSLAINLRSIVQDEKVQLELKQTVSTVFDPVHANIKNEWSLSHLFGKKLLSKCPLASTSNILVDLNIANIKRSTIRPEPTRYHLIDASGEDKKMALYDLLTYDLSNGLDLQLSIEYSHNNLNHPYLLAYKFTTGYGDEKGGTTCQIKNSHPTQTFRVSYLDVMPYFVRTYYHTFHIQLNGLTAKPDQLKFIPAYGRDRPASIEFLLEIPPMSTASVSVEFEKVFLDWMQHPPDSHHGFYIGSSVISTTFPDHENSSGIDGRCSGITRTCIDPSTGIFRRIYTEPLLIRVPLPDFSMPYNVICLTCTVIAIAFGSIYNLSTRTFQVEVESEKKTVKQKVTSFLKNMFKKEKTS